MKAMDMFLGMMFGFGMMLMCISLVMNFMPVVGVPWSTFFKGVVFMWMMGVGMIGLMALLMWLVA